MAASLSQVTTHTTGTTNPVTISVTTTANDHVMVLCLVVASATQRTGGTPTFNGVNMTQAGTTAQAASAPETSVEIWYLFNPDITTANVSIPNAGGLTIRRDVSCYKSTTGKFKVGTAGTNSGTSTNPSLSVNVPYDDSVWISAVGTGATTWAPSAQDGTILYNTDHGANGMGSQYGIKATSGTQSMGWTEASNDDWAIVGISFAADQAPTVSLNSPADASSTSDTTPTLDFTGTDTEGSDIRYRVQIDTVNTFDSTVGAGPSYDTSVTANGNGVNSFAFGALTTAEEDEILIATIDFSNTTPSGVTFDGDLTWTQIGTAISKPNLGGEVYHYWALATHKLTSVVFTATFTGGGFPQASGVISAWKGADTSSPIGDHQTGTANNTTAVSATVTTTRNNSLVIAGTGQTGNNTYSAGSGETIASQVQGGTVSRTVNSYQNSVTTSSSTSVQMDITIGANDDMGMRAIELKAALVPLLNKVSGTDSGFANPDVGGDTDPFTSGDNIQYTVQAGDALSLTTYYWRVKAKDPTGSNRYGAYSSTRSFTISSGGASVSDSTSLSESIKMLLTSDVTISDSSSLSESINATLAYNAEVSDSTGLTESLAALLVSLVNVSDTTTVTEAVGILTTTFVNVSDTTTITEDMPLLLTSFVNVSDTATTSEETNATQVYTSTVDDTATLTEAVTLLVSSPVTVSDTVTLSENVQLDPLSFVTVSDTTTLTESAPAQVVFIISVSDSSSVAESIQLLETGFVNVSDTVGTSEEISLLPLSFVEVSDTIGTTESSTTEIAAADAMTINVSDAAGVTEATQLLETSFVAVSDTTTISEDALFLLTAFVATQDSTTVTESLAALLIGLVNVTDTTTTTESVAIDLSAPQVAVSDTTTVVEAVTLNLVALVSTSDTTTLSETIKVLLVSQVATTDTTTVVDYPNYYPDTIYTSESVTVVIQAADTSLSVNVSESVTLTESLTLLETSFVTVSESTSLTEALILLLSSFLTTSDSLTVSEEFTALLVSFIAVADTTTVTESVQLDQDNSVNVSDTTTVSESVLALLVSLIAVSDTATLTEDVTLRVSDMQVTVSDSVTVTEAVSANRSGNLNITVSDTIGPYRLIFADFRPALRLTGRFYLIIG